MKKITLSEDLTTKNSIHIFGRLNKQIIIEIIALLFIILFLYTAISKLMEYSIFKEQLATSPVLKPVASIIAISLPVTEIIVAISLFIYRWRLYGLYASFVLMMLFTGYIAAILTFSSEIPCSCGGVLAQLSWLQHLIFNSVLIAFAFVGIKLSRKL